MQPKDKRHYKQDAGTNGCNANSHWLLLGSSHCSSSRRTSATATLTRSQRLTRSSAIISRTTTQSVRIRCLVSLHPGPRNQPLQTAGGSLAIDQIGGGLGIRTPGGVITVAFTLGRRSYAQRIEQRFLRSRQLFVPIGFLCFLSLKYHQRCIRLFFIRLS